ncbi:hypothetical protein [Bradyrhizobium canariense]|uniref:hypothetical protein n=1 Tax=Bradyrhizobium canariense TaxID=255045 RepID=UPI001FDAB2AE|nr:hypothetical protein [Bradyrhizobium canariense]
MTGSSVTHDQSRARIEERHLRGALDDVIIVPLVLIAIAASKILHFTISVLMRLLDYTFPLVMEIVWLPLFAAKVLGNFVVAAVGAALRILPLSETRRRKWIISMRRRWSRFRRKISYRAFERTMHLAFASGMAWVFRTCRHLTPNTALLVILAAVLWLPISFGVATAMHAVLFAKLASWPAWMQLLHPVATVIAKSKLLVLPVYPAAWPQAKKSVFARFMGKAYDNIQRQYVTRKLGYRYRQAETIGVAVLHALMRSACFASLGRWLQNAHVTEHLGVERPTQKLRLFFSRWSVKFSAEYYEAQERQASNPL